MDCNICKNCKEATDLNCKICNKKFKIWSEFMSHRKHDHSESIPSCTNILNGGTCFYGPVMCRFRHTETVRENANINFEEKNFTEKLFDMMENLHNN